MQRLPLAIVLAATALAACGSAPPAPALEASEEDGSACEACIAGGGTWQPERDECTENCNVADISCFRDECPGPCGRDTCEQCFSSASCADAGCRWMVEAEATWCGDP